MSEPKRKRTARERRMRTYTVLALLIALAFAVFLLWRQCSGAGPEPTPSPSATASADAVGPSASASASASAPETAEPSTSPSASASPSNSITWDGLGENGIPQEFPPCSADQVVIQALTDKESYGKGEKVQMHFMLVNTGKEPCTLNAGTTQQEYEIRDAAGGVVYRFSDCRKDAVDQLIALHPNEPRRTTPIEWDRRMSNKDKCGEQGKEVPAGDAVYTLRVGIGQVQGEGERQFRLD